MFNLRVVYLLRDPSAVAQRRPAANVALARESDAAVAGGARPPAPARRGHAARLLRHPRRPLRIDGRPGVDERTGDVHGFLAEPAVPRGGQDGAAPAGCGARRPPTTAAARSPSSPARPAARPWPRPRPAMSRSSARSSSAPLTVDEQHHLRAACREHSRCAGPRRGVTIASGARRVASSPRRRVASPPSSASSASPAKRVLGIRYPTAGHAAGAPQSPVPRGRARGEAGRLTFPSAGGCGSV